MRSHLLFIILSSFVFSSLISTIFFVELLRIPDKPSQVWGLIFWKFPALFSFSIPFSVFAGIFISYYFMKIRNELMALPSIGFDGKFLFKNSIPIFLLICLFLFIFMEGIVVKSEKRFLEIKSLYKEEITVPKTDYWTKRKNYIFHFGSIFPEKGLIFDIEIFFIDEGRITSLIKAKMGKIDEDGIMIEKARIYKYGFPAEMTDSLKIPINGFLLEKRFSESEIFALSLFELCRMKKILEKEDIDTSIYRNFIWTKLIFISISFIGGISSIGIPYAGEIFTFSPFLKSIGLFFLSVFLIFLTLALSFRGFIHPFFVIMIAVFECGAISYYLNRCFQGRKI